MTGLWFPAEEISRYACSRKRTVSFTEVTSSEELHAPQRAAAVTKFMALCYFIRPIQPMMSYKLFVLILSQYVGYACPTRAALRSYILVE